MNTDLAEGEVALCEMLEHILGAHGVIQLQLQVLNHALCLLELLDSSVEGCCKPYQCRPQSAQPYRAGARQPLLTL